MQTGTQSQKWEICWLRATNSLRLEKDPQWRKCYGDKGDLCVGGNPVLFFKIENKSWQRQSPGSSGEAGHKGKAGHRRWLTNVPSLDCAGQTEIGLSLLWGRWKRWGRPLYKFPMETSRHFRNSWNPWCVALALHWLSENSLEGYSR